MNKTNYLGSPCTLCICSSAYSSSGLLRLSVTFYDAGEQVGEVVWLEFVARAFVEFVLELDPVETQGVQEALQQVHAHQHAKCDGPKNGPEYERDANCAAHRLYVETVTEG